MSKKKILIIGSFVVLFALGVIMSLGYEKDDDVYIPNVTPTEVVYEDYIIEIKGEVVRPGLYLVNETYCINDCIILAGGLTKNASTDSLKLASKVSDGQTIFVPTKSQTDQENQINKISINTATVSELTSIPGIGSVIATNIVEYRNTHGKFQSLEELCNVQRISENLFNKIKEYICL